MRRAVFLIILSFYFAPLVQAADFAPPEGQTLLFIGQDKRSIMDYIHHVRIVPAGFMSYTSLRNLEGILKPMNHGGGVQHAQWLLNHYRQSSLQMGLYLVDDLDRILSGDLDTNIKKLARWIKRTERPIYLRIGYEFDNPDNKYDPEKYKAAFRYMVSMMRQLDVKNVSYVWHSQAAQTDLNPMEWYPGDEFIDWVAASYFSPYNTDNMNKILKIARKRNKPFMLAESTALKIDFSDGEDAFKRWFGLVFEYIQENKVEAFCYINTNWDKQYMHAYLQWGDARVQKNTVLMKKWKKAISQPSFVNASKDHFSNIGFKMNKSSTRHRYY